MVDAITVPLCDLPRNYITNKTFDYTITVFHNYNLINTSTYHLIQLLGDPYALIMILSKYLPYGLYTILNCKFTYVVLMIVLL